ncbi:MAG TPA: hypothetical protein VHL52_12280 [Acidimicrobiia bacterium]|nr:hypothetical protein [Acidimicrobiia bacterium]
MRTITALLALSTLVLAACDGGAGGSDTSVPSDPDSVVLTVTSEGGFVPVEFNLDRMPRFVLTADRTVYFQGPMIEIFPGPLLPNVQVTTLSEEGYAEVMELVGELGLPDIDERIDNSAAEMVADATTEFITYRDENGSHRLGIYAMGLVDGGSTDRVLATELVQTLEQATLEGESQAYEPERLQVAAGPAIQFDEIEASVEEWPLEVPFAEMEEWGLGWRCTEVTGEAVEPLLDVFSQATQATLWDTGSEQVSIRAHPLFPGETACTGGPQAG